MSEEYLIILKKALKGIALTEDENKLIKWIAGWDLWTCLLYTSPSPRD